MTGHRGAAVRPAPACAVLDRLASLNGEPYELRVLSGGLTNRNYEVSTASGRHLVARFSDSKSALLAIDRDAEYANSVRASASGIGPAVIDYAPAHNLLVVDWIAGKTCTDADLADETHLTRVAAACRVLHSSARFAGDFDMFDIQRGYLRIVQEYGFRLPEDYLEHLPAVQRIEQVLGASGRGTVPCHNDLLAANIMDDGDRIWFIDYEYSGNNDPCFELGNIWSEACLGDELLEHLIASYFGAPDPVQVARARLFGLMSKYGWTLWASIQDAVSDVDFDFWDWGMEKYARAVAEFRGRELDHLISTIWESSTPEGAAPWPK